MRYLLTVFLIAICLNSFTQIQKGKVIVDKFLASSIQDNPGGEDANRQVSVYLPYGYDNGKRYPVIYFLHGFTVDQTSYLDTFHIKDLLDEAISKGIIRPVIVVFPNSYTTF